MTNSKKLESLFTNIESKAAIFMDGYFAGVGNSEQAYLFASDPVSSALIREAARNAFMQRALDINITEVLDGYFIDYPKLIVHPDDEYVPVTWEI